MENGVTVTTLLSGLNKRVLLAQMDTCRSIHLMIEKMRKMKPHGKVNHFVCWVSLCCVCVCVCIGECVTQVTLACDDGVTVRTVEFGHVLRVFLQNVHLHGSTLGKSGMADVAFIRFLS